MRHPSRAARAIRNNPRGRSADRGASRLSCRRPGGSAQHRGQRAAVSPLRGIEQFLPQRTKFPFFAGAWRSLVLGSGPRPLGLHRSARPRNSRKEEDEGDVVSHDARFIVTGSETTDLARQYAPVRRIARRCSRIHGRIGVRERSAANPRTRNTLSRSGFSRN